MNYALTLVIYRAELCDRQQFTCEFLNCLVRCTCTYIHGMNSQQCGDVFDEAAVCLSVCLSVKDRGDLALHVAARLHNTDMAKLLAEHHADVDKQNVMLRR